MVFRVDGATKERAGRANLDGQNVETDSDEVREQFGILIAHLDACAVLNYGIVTFDGTGKYMRLTCKA
jgi:hypothetical protein